MSTLAPTAETAPDRRWLVLVLVCIARFMVVLDATAVNVALPSIPTPASTSRSAHGMRPEGATPAAAASSS